MEVMIDSRIRNANSLNRNIHYLNLNSYSVLCIHFRNPDFQITNVALHNHRSAVSTRSVRKCNRAQRLSAVGGSNCSNSKGKYAQKPKSRGSRCHAPSPKNVLNTPNAFQAGSPSSKPFAEAKRFSGQHGATKGKPVPHCHPSRCPVQKAKIGDVSNREVHWRAYTFMKNQRNLWSSIQQDSPRTWPTLRNATRIFVRFLLGRPPARS